MLDGSEDGILYEESDALSENNHEDDFSGSDDDFLVFPFIQYSVWRQVQSLLQNDASI